MYIIKTWINLGSNGSRIIYESSAFLSLIVASRLGDGLFSSLFLTLAISHKCRWTSWNYPLEPKDQPTSRPAHFGASWEWVLGDFLREHPYHQVGTNMFSWDFIRTSTIKKHLFGFRSPDIQRWEVLQMVVISPSNQPSVLSKLHAVFSLLGQCICTSIYLCDGTT